MKQANKILYYFHSHQHWLPPQQEVGEHGSSRDASNTFANNFDVFSVTSIVSAVVSLPTCQVTQNLIPYHGIPEHWCQLKLIAGMLLC